VRAAQHCGWVNALFGQTRFGLLPVSAVLRQKPPFNPLFVAKVSQNSQKWAQISPNGLLRTRLKFSNIGLGFFHFSV